MESIYLDSNATTRPLPEVVAAVQEAMTELWANPSSVHRAGQQVRQRIELARKNVAALIGAKPREILFTSGGTEANNLAVLGMLPDPARAVLITTPVEHSAIRAPADHLAAAGATVHRLPLSSDGVIDPAAIFSLITNPSTDTDAAPTILVSIQWANNETGVIQPVADVARAIQFARGELRQRDAKTKVFFHIDATQAVGKIPVSVKAVSADLLTLAAHKFHGPKGVGALFVRTGVRVRPQQLGGPQEREKRGGTENVPGILGMGVAADAARRLVADKEALEVGFEIRDAFENGILRSVPGAIVNGAGAPRLWNTSNIAFPGLEAEAILLALSERGISASAGAACSSGSLEPSPVLLAMGVKEPVAHGSVRFSTCRDTTVAMAHRAAEVVREVVERLRKTMPVGV